VYAFFVCLETEIFKTSGHPVSFNNFFCMNQLSLTQALTTPNAPGRQYFGELTTWPTSFRLPLFVVNLNLSNEDMGFPLITLRRQLQTVGLYYLVDHLLYIEERPSE
jgi:hypothetical protein